VTQLVSLLRSKRAAQLIETTHWASNLHEAFEQRIRLKNAISDGDAIRAQIVMAIHRHQIEMRRVTEALHQLKDAAPPPDASGEAADEHEQLLTQHNEYCDQIRLELTQRIESLHKHDVSRTFLRLFGVALAFAALICCPLSAADNDDK
jgi:hypothetical protein